MTHGVLSHALRATNPLTTNGNARGQHSLEQLTSEWRCVKRNGDEVQFDVGKIRHAVDRCFQQIGMADADRPAMVEKITRGVVAAITQRELEKVAVEEVQRFVIAQLWTEGLFDAAEHYQNYREEHRKLRLTKPISTEVQSRFDEMQKHFPTDLQIYQLMSKFARWREEDQRRETWHELVYDRVMPWFKKTVRSKGHDLEPQEWHMLSKAMYGLEASPAMRVVQMAGPALDRCNVGVYNCAYQPIEDLFSFPEMLYILMQGTGAGFSVESDYVSELPRIKKQRGGKQETIVVEDSTEGWCNSFYEGLQRWWDGYDVWFNTDKVRKQGTRLKTKGGRASGPGPFLELMAFTRNMVMARQGRFLEDTDAHRLSCFTGRIVQVGGVRRAATISLSDLTSMGMRNIKSGSWYNDTTYWTDGRYLTMANNSSVYDFPDQLPPVEVFMEEWLALVKSKSGERGIFNRQAALKHKPARRKAAKFGCNPCAEIILRPYEFCNLSIAVARPDDTEETLTHKVVVAAYFGVMQSLCTDFRYIRGDWKKNCDEERLLGVDITGHADCPLLRHGAPGRAELLRRLNAKVAEVAQKLGQRFGINYSAANTTVKPSGDSAIFFDCASGVSPRFAAHQIRWVREAKDSPVSKFLIDAGVPYAPAPESPDRLWVFGFPKKAPEGCTLRNDMTAEQQFFNWLEWKTNWSEHSVSATIYVEEHEWPRLGALVYEHIDHITGLSFLPKDNGVYTYAPNEELTEEQFHDFVRKFPRLNWAKITHYEDEDMTTGSQTLACTNGGCSLV